MKDKITLDQYKKEFKDEIESVPLDVSSFNAIKVSNKTLAKEVYLRQKLGDEIYKKKNEDKIDGGNKVVEKLTDAEIAFDERVKQACENVVDKDIDSDINLFLARASQGEETYEE